MPSQSPPLLHYTGWKDRLRSVRLRRGLATQEQLAQKLGIDRRIVSRWEKGQLPSTDKLMVVATALQVSLDWLLLGRGQMDLPALAGM